MSYTIIPLDKLNEVRAETRKQLAELTKSTGKEYYLRTFYIGPRPKPAGRESWRYATRPASTLMKNARHAKLAIYEVTSKHRDGVYVYINGKYSHCLPDAGKLRAYGNRIAYV